MNEKNNDLDFFFDFHTHQRYDTAEIVAVENVIVGKETVEDKKKFSVGLHPLFLENINIDETLRALEEKVKDDNCWSIGECGLDKRAVTTIDTQTAIFVAQIFLAEKYRQPVVIHCVKAFEELIAIKKKYQPKTPMIIHGFNNNEAVFKKLEACGFYFSFGAALLHPESNAVKALRQVSKSKFFLETDDKKIDIRAIYDAASHCLNLDKNIIKSLIINNLWKIRNLDS
jgi:TatD DNase family protein